MTYGKGYDPPFISGFVIIIMLRNNRWYNRQQNKNNRCKYSTHQINRLIMIEGHTAKRPMRCKKTDRKDSGCQIPPGSHTESGISLTKCACHCFISGACQCHHFSRITAHINALRHGKDQHQNRNDPGKTGNLRRE